MLIAPRRRACAGRRGSCRRTWRPFFAKDAREAADTAEAAARRRGSAPPAIRARRQRMVDPRRRAAPRRWPGSRARRASAKPRRIQRSTAIACEGLTLLRRAEILRGPRARGRGQGRRAAAQSARRGSRRARDRGDRRALGGAARWRIEGHATRARSGARPWPRGHRARHGPSRVHPRARGARRGLARGDPAPGGDWPAIRRGVGARVGGGPRSRRSKMIIPPCLRHSAPFQVQPAGQTRGSPAARRPPAEADCVARRTRTRGSAEGRRTGSTSPRRIVSRQRVPSRASRAAERRRSRALGRPSAARA